MDEALAVYDEYVKNSGEAAEGGAENSEAKQEAAEAAEMKA